MDRRKTAYNSTYPKGGGSFSADTFVQAESPVLQMVKQSYGHLLFAIKTPFLVLTFVQLIGCG